MESLFPSRLRHRVTLQEPVLTPDGAGGFSKGWQTVATLWAEVVPVSNRAWQSERPFGSQLEMRVTHRVRLRYRAGVTAAMRLIHRERVLNVRAVWDVDERSKMLEILAEEGVA